LSDTSFLDSIRQLGALLRAEADAAEVARQLTPAVLEAMHRAGVFRMFVPRTLGGDERTMSADLAVIEELGRHDGAAAWVAFVVSGSPFVLSRLPDAGAEEIFAGPEPVVCGSLVPPGTARAEADGFRLDGREANHREAWDKEKVDPFRHSATHE
jgi:indole-3-acetate monooxygenase